MSSELDCAAHFSQTERIKQTQIPKKEERSLNEHIKESCLNIPHQEILRRDLIISIDKEPCSSVDYSAKENSDLASVSNNLSKRINTQILHNCCQKVKKAKIIKNIDLTELKHNEFTANLTCSNKNMKKSPLNLCTHESENLKDFDKFVSRTSRQNYYVRQDYNFKPRINQKSKDLKREESIENHLYKDAIRRMTKNHGNIVKAYQSPTNRNSTKILKNKFVEEFNRIGSEPISYSIFLTILEQMNFIKSDSDRDLAFKAWKTLGKDRVNKKELLSFLLSVMNLKEPKSLHFSFIQLYRNRVSKHKDNQVASFDFKPVISERSTKLAENHYKKKRLGNSPLEFLSNEGKTSKNSHIKKKIDNQKAEEDECSFKPEINKPLKHTQSDCNVDSNAYIYKRIRQANSSTGDVSSNLYKLSLEIRDRTVNISHQEECFSFRPTLRTSLLKGKKPHTLAKGVTSTIARMQKARNMNLSQKLPRNNQQDLRYSENQKFKNLSRLLSKGKNRKSGEVLQSFPMDVTVGLPNGNVETFEVKSLHDFEFSLDKFVQKHALDKKTEINLKKSLFQKTFVI